ncbi:uncharacterized protein LOC108465860 [Gossypium arboreum]|uniref:uncharacterized protein LOC108465860 n=1 Tax=Gossypium arboreum TaxID=29729 RepID=UPI0008195981|nr:uncharacterized protein LOC108465860 [Gossypium arboreum]
MEFGINKDGVLCFGGQICVPNDEDLRQSILREARSSLYAIHPNENKMYRDLWYVYWWPGLKSEVTDFIGCCLTCQQVKAEHQLPSSLLQPIKIPIQDRLFSTKVGQALYFRNSEVAWDMLSETKDKVCLIQDRLKATSDSHNGKLSPRFIGPYRILRRVGPVAYQLELPVELDSIHDVLHVFMLRRYRSDPTHIVPIEEIEVRPDLTFEEEPIQILDCDVKVLRRKSIPLVKVNGITIALRRLRGSRRMRCDSSILIYSDQVAHKSHIRDVHKEPHQEVHKEPYREVRIANIGKFMEHYRKAYKERINGNLTKSL